MMLGEVASTTPGRAGSGPALTSADLLWWSMALILAVLVLGLVIVLVKRKTVNKKDEAPGLVYSLHDLRRMLKMGEISEKEFEKLKDIVNTETRRTGPLSK